MIVARLGVLGLRKENAMIRRRVSVLCSFALPTLSHTDLSRGLARSCLAGRCSRENNEEAGTWPQRLPGRTRLSCMCSISIYDRQGWAGSARARRHHAAYGWGRELRLEGRVEANGHISQCDAVHTCSSNGTRRDLPRVPDMVKEGKKSLSSVPYVAVSTCLCARRRMSNMALDRESV